MNDDDQTDKFVTISTTYSDEWDDVTKVSPMLTDEEAIRDLQSRGISYGTDRPTCDMRRPENCDGIPTYIVSDERTRPYHHANGRVMVVIGDGS